MKELEQLLQVLQEDLNRNTEANRTETNPLQYLLRQESNLIIVGYIQIINNMLNSMVKETKPKDVKTDELFNVDNKKK